MLKNNYEFENIADFVYSYIDEFVKPRQERAVKRWLKYAIASSALNHNKFREIVSNTFCLINPAIKYANAKKTENEVTEALEDALMIFFEED